MADTPRLELPIMASAQSQKHVTFNDAMYRLESVTQLAVINSATTSRPTTPSEGDTYIVAAGATGDWLGRDGQIAAYLDNQWYYSIPKNGWLAFDIFADRHLRYTGSAWIAAFSVSGASFGWENHQDTTTGTTPIDMVSANTWYTLTNDSAGALSTTTYQIPGVGPIWDTATNTLDFSTMDVGDTLRVRFDASVITGGANHDIECRLNFGPTYTFSNNFYKQSFKSAGTHQIFTEFSFAMFNTATRDNPARFQIRSDSTGDNAVVNGWKLEVQKV